MAEQRSKIGDSAMWFGSGLEAEGIDWVRRAVPAMARTHAGFFGFWTQRSYSHARRDRPVQAASAT